MKSLTHSWISRAEAVSLAYGPNVPGPRLCQEPATPRPSPTHSRTVLVIFTGGKQTQQGWADRSWMVGHLNTATEIQLALLTQDLIHLRFCDTHVSQAPPRFKRIG